MNHNGETFDWGNEPLANLEIDSTEDKLVNPDFIAGIPGIETVAEYEDIVCPHLAAQCHNTTVALKVAATCQSAGRAKNVTATHRGVDDVDVSATASVMDLRDKHLFLSGSPMTVMQEWLMRIWSIISQMEECIFLCKKWSMRIRVTISQMEEWICLGKKWLMKMQKLVMPPKIEECAKVRETGSQERGMSLWCKVKYMQKESTRGLDSPR